MMTPVAIVLIDAAVWAGWSAVVGTTVSRIPAARLGQDGRLTRLRAFERGGRSYERVGIKRWKDRLPEAGTFSGGVSKRRLPHRPGGLVAFAAETRRAEVAHWAILAATPFFALWNPVPLTVAMVAYGVVANLPCIAIQRYNRGRIERVRRRLPAPDGRDAVTP